MGFASKLGTLFSAVTATGSKLRQALDFAAPVTLASAATVNIGAAASNRLKISGTTPVSAFDSIAAGAVRTITFTGAVPLVHNGVSLILPGGANITAAVGDVAEFESLGGGNWRCTDFQRAASLGGVVPVDVQTFNASGTWTKPAGGQTMARIQQWGAGGGGSRSTNASQTSGGGGGAYSEVVVPISYLADSVAVTVGTGGAGATVSTNGGNGGNSSVPLANFPGGAKTVTAFGGAGGSVGFGGGGGGQAGAAVVGWGLPGEPLVGARSYYNGTTNVFVGSMLQGGGASSPDFMHASGGISHGGGGGTYTYVPGNSVWGGGGGGSNASGTSVHGGAGGQNAAGSVPGGGGGFAASSNINGSNGGAGRVIITSF